MALDLSDRHLTFDDEFNSFHGWDTTIFGSRTLSNNGEQQFYSDTSVGVNPFSIDNGTLKITASPNGNPHGLPYNSGVITTLNDFSQQYGYFEMRAELPEGKGMWPAFWLLPKSQAWPPEIDILEAFGAPSGDGQGGGNLAHINAISTVDGQSGGKWVTVPGNIYNQFHTYGVDWQPDTLTYYIDGQMVSQMKTPDDMHQPMFMLANLAVGGHWAGNPDGSTGQMSIDYIRAYSAKPDSSGSSVAQQPISPPDTTDTSHSNTQDATQSSVPSTDTTHSSVLPTDTTQVGANNTAAATHPQSATPAAPMDATSIMPPNTVTDGTALPTPAGAAVPTTADATSGTPAGSGNGAMMLHVSQDAWNGNAQFIVVVDGQQVGGVQSVTASHAQGQWQDIAIDGTFDNGPHNVAVKFVNDAWGGAANADRNLYVQSLEMNGVTLAGNQALNNAARGFESADPGAAVMMVNGAVEFHVPQGTTGDVWHV